MKEANIYRVWKAEDKPGFYVDGEDGYAFFEDCLSVYEAIARYRKESCKMRWENDDQIW